MKTSTLKKEIHLAIDHTKDNEILEAVYTILRKSAKDEEEQITLSAEDIKELDRRWDSYKNGKSKTYTLEEAKKEIRKKIKAIKH
ncbi:MAG: addiction module protein [Bacteroidetes bacterium]|jgi:putative addiction module component (TIGR02574 family)|nr:addiction module protein [Bacteroidota bacterium]